MDREAYLVATSTKDALGVPPSVRSAMDMATCMDDGSGHAASACDIKDTTGHAAPTMGTPDMPSSTCSPMDAAIGCASSIDVVAAPTPLMLTTSAVPVGS